MRHYILYHNPERMGYDFGGNLVEFEAEFEPVYSEDWFIYGYDWSDWKSQYDEDFTWEDIVTGDIYQEADLTSFETIVTNNKKEALEAKGQRVWIIQGEVGTKPRRFWLHGYFDATNTLRRIQKTNDKKFEYMVMGKEGILESIDGAIEVTHLDWFLRLKRELKNFRRGFREVMDSGLIFEMEECFSQRKIPGHKEKAPDT